MTEAELQAEEAAGAKQAGYQHLIDEVRRLRGLVKSGEWASGPYADNRVCPWCDVEEPFGSRVSPHLDDCPAFTPEGEVR